MFALPFRKNQIRPALWMGSILLAAGLLIGCAPIAAPAPTTPTVEAPPETPQPEIEEPAIEEPIMEEPVEMEPIGEVEGNVQAHVAQEEGVDPGEVYIVEMEAVDWPDGCLGAAQAAEMCIQVITPGYRVVVEVEGSSRVYHTNVDGTHIRPAQNGASDIDAPQDAPQSDDPTREDDPQAAQEQEGEAIAMSVRQMLMQQLHADFDTLEIVEVEAVEWSDSCLGVANPVELCAQMITPGYRIVIEAQHNDTTEVYIYHTDSTGNSVRLYAGPRPETGEVVIRWSGYQADVEGECQEAEIGLEGVAFSRCYALPMQGYLAGPERAAELAAFAETYAPFTADTPAGSVEFFGTGDQTAAESEQRMIAEWARLVALEAGAGRSGASWGLGFAWFREGGIAGFCDHLSVYVSGHVAASRCNGEDYTALGERRLSAQELTQLFAWLDTYANFETETTDGAVADGMTTRMVFSGAGLDSASADVQHELADFAARLFAGLE